MRWTNLLALGLAVAFSTGCTSYESARTVAATGGDMTDALEEQIMENLIRARNGLPFVHYDVQNIQANVQSRVDPRVTGGRTEVTNSLRPRGNTTVRNGDGLITAATTVVGAAGAILGTVTKPIGFDMAGSRQNASSVTLVPVLKEPDTYFAYTEFLNSPKKEFSSETNSWRPDPKWTADTGEKGGGGSAPEMKTSAKKIQKVKTETKDGSNQPQASVTQSTEETIEVPKDPAPAPKPEVRLKFDYLERRPDGWISSLEKGKKAPRSGEYVPHTLKKWEGSYYWVPKAFVGEFSDLCLAVVARGTLVATKSKYGKPSASATSRPAIIIAPGADTEVERALNLNNLELNNLNNLFRSLR